MSEQIRIFYHSWYIFVAEYENKHHDHERIFDDLQRCSWIKTTSTSERKATFCWKFPSILYSGSRKLKVWSRFHSLLLCFVQDLIDVANGELLIYLNPIYSRFSVHITEECVVISSQFCLISINYLFFSSLVTLGPALMHVFFALLFSKVNFSSCDFGQTWDK